jgi:hypothetical protein
MRLTSKRRPGTDGNFFEFIHLPLSSAKNETSRRRRERKKEEGKEEKDRENTSLCNKVTGSLNKR